MTFFRIQKVYSVNFTCRSCGEPSVRHFALAYTFEHDLAFQNGICIKCYFEKNLPEDFHLFNELPVTKAPFADYDPEAAQPPKKRGPKTKRGKKASCE
jgi:hypothetical protein